jgi:D-amino-acid dehydrogenase
LSITLVFLPWGRSMAKIAIIGGGITGMTSAYSLLRRGHDVTLLDSHRYPAMGTSYANGGQLSAGNAEVWNNWPTMLKGLRWMLRRDAPLLFNPKPRYHKYSWAAEFGANIFNYRDNTIQTTRLAIAAREHLLAMANDEGIAFDYKQTGLLNLYHDRQSFGAAAKANRLLCEGGLDRRAVTPEEIAKIEPTLRGDFFGGFFTPSDASGDIHLFTRGLANACLRRGATLLQNATVGSIDVSGSGVRLNVAVDDNTSATIDAEAVVVCAGVGSRRLAAALGDRINIYPVKGYSITVGLDDQPSRAAAPNVCLLDDAAKIVTSRLGPNRLRVAGTAEFNGFNRDIRADRIRPLVDWTERHFPEISTSAITPWAGLRPMTPTMLPRVGRGRHERVFYNTGHGHLGWTLSTVTSQVLADQLDQTIG